MKKLKITVLSIISAFVLFWIGSIAMCDIIHISMVKFLEIQKYTILAEKDI